MFVKSICVTLFLFFVGCACVQPDCNAVSACLNPVRVGVFAGRGPCSNGAVEWFRLVNGSPDLALTLLDGEAVRGGALNALDMIVMPGGSSAKEKSDLGTKGIEKLKAFIRDGGGYLGTCAGCSLLLDDRTDPERGIGLMPYRRIGSKGGNMVQVALNEKGATALGLPQKEYRVRYNAGPVLAPSGRVIEGAAIESWGTYASDFGKPGSEPAMFGCPAVVGGTYGKGRVFAIACHPENFLGTREIIVGAFRYVAGRDVRFPERQRSRGALSVGVFTPVIAGVDVARTILRIDEMRDVDLFPIDWDYMMHGMLDHVDVLVLPDGNAVSYGKNKTVLEKYLTGFVQRGGVLLGWGAGSKPAFPGLKALASADAVLAAIGEMAAVRDIDTPPKSKTVVVGIAESCPTGGMSGVKSEYTLAVYAAGAVPLILPTTTNAVEIARLLECVDMLLLAGGEDIETFRYGEKDGGKLGEVNVRRDYWEFALLDAAIRRRLPILGVCRGCQVLNVCFGGSLWQDVPTDKQGANSHRLKNDGEHAVSVVPASYLSKLVSGTSASVNSRHHQAVKAVAPGFRVTAV